MKIFCEDKKDNNEYPTVLDLNIAEADKICMIYTTGSKDLMQLILLSGTDDKILHILTWDLIKNIEYSLT